MPSRRKSTGLTNRDLGISGGSGKGSATRVTSNAKFSKNYESINWGRRVTANEINGGTFPKNAGETVRPVNAFEKFTNATVDAWNKVLSKNVFVSDAGKIERQG